MRVEALVLASQGCVWAIPPASQITGVTGVSARSTGAVDAAAAVGSEPAVGAGVTLFATDALAVEVRGQLTDSAAAAAPGVWLRFPLGSSDRVWLGNRLGPVVGTGELGRFVPYDNPYAGGSWNAQLGWRVGRNPDNPGVVAITTGVEITLPLYGDTHPHVEQVRVGDERVDLVLLAGRWVPTELRIEAPVGPAGALTGSIGADWFGAEPLPRASLGVRLGLGPADER